MMLLMMAGRKSWKLLGHQSANIIFFIHDNAAAMGDLNGLALTRSERVLVIGLSYAWSTPLIFWFGERILHYLRAWRGTTGVQRPRD